MLPRKFAILSLTVAALLLVLTAFTIVGMPSISSGASLAPTASTTTPATIIQTKSGLVASDSLKTGTTSYWTFGGDAPAQGAQYSYNENSSGLYIGVKAAISGQYAGYYAVSPDTSADLFHAVISLPYSSVPGNSFNTGIYVQTSDNDFIDYVGCLAVAVPQGYYWVVVQSYGVLVGSQVISTLYQSSLNTMPLTQDCTIITNGNNYLKVYLGSNIVVNRNNMTLNMPTPFQAYLEAESSTTSSMLFGKYTNYYATQSEGVTVTNAPVGGTADIVNASSNTVLASAQVGANGNATMLVGTYALPLNAYIKVFNSNNTLIASTTSVVTIWGGDVYSISSAPSSGITLIGTQSTSGTVLAPPYQFTISNFNAGTLNNRLIVVGISANDESATSVTFNGMSFTQAVISFYNNDAEFWYLEQPFPTGAGNITITMAGPTSAVIGAYAFSGVAQGIPISAKATNHNTANGSPSIFITTKSTNSWVLDLPSIYGSVTLNSPTCTERWDANVPNAISGASSSLVTTSPGQYTCVWTASGGGELWDDAAIEIQPAAVSPGITVDAHRISASYWDPCFAAVCSAGTGPGVSMYVELLNSSGAVIQTGYANEYGYTFTGLNPSATYYVYPTDCDSCNGAMHNVVFQYWGDGSTVRPIAVTVGTTLDAWYSCTNQCLGGP